MDEVEVYSPEEDSWYVVGTTRTARTGACAVLVENKVYMFGGEEEAGTGGPIAEVETYRVTMEGMMELIDDNEIPDMPEALCNPSASLVAPNIIMVVESDRVYLLHLDANIWTRGPPLTVARHSLQSVMIDIN